VEKGAYNRGQRGVKKEGGQKIIVDEAREQRTHPNSFECWKSLSLKNQTQPNRNANLDGSVRVPR